MKKFLIKSGFTLAEIMVCFAVLGVIATVSMPIISAKKLDNNRILFKKAYSTVERAVYELVNDPELYPDKDGCSGIDNTDQVTYSVNGRRYSGNTKFRDLFQQKLNVSSTSGQSITTIDGVVYTVPNTNFPNALEITVDVNGSKGPNSTDVVAQPDTCNDNRDRFVIIVDANGKVHSNGACARKYMGDVNFNSN